MKDMLKIPRGNPFKMYLCPQRIAPRQSEASFALIEDLCVKLTRHDRDGVDVSYQITPEGDMLVVIPSTLKCTTYGLEIKGTYQGNPWRWADYNVFQVTDCNPCSNVIPMESFGVETYYIYDDIFPSFNESNELLLLNTHYHAWVDGQTLFLMASENTDMEIINNTLIIRENGNIKNQGRRPSRQCCC